MKYNEKLTAGWENRYPLSAMISSKSSWSEKFKNTYALREAPRQRSIIWFIYSKSKSCKTINPFVKRKLSFKRFTACFP